MSLLKFYYFGTASIKGQHLFANLDVYQVVKYFTDLYYNDLIGIIMTFSIILSDIQAQKHSFKKIIF